ncbi:nucleotidyl transferase AbiEii/AbiGii toxin family protein [Catelliglobosispora koreensis]|uniref:nucleotidyl transferase AbiEii/AbiGii toxin family protein n=1 Tax=Catelliglobosispora koreensis TaxID=129052 RepID=UPI0003652A71|nr:nucleotidyl transferase AbiEii/AbiGii toxin family protein [Catelliglobosispora koreensis]
MSTDPFQAEVTRLALSAAAPHGYALAGGQALMAHGIVSRHTEDIDLFTDVDDAALTVAQPLQTALEQAGLHTEVISGPDELFEGMANDMVELEVSHGTETVRVSLAHFRRIKPPVTLDIGPVLHLDDVLGSKIAALATRAEPRDFIDVAAALRQYPAAELIRLGQQADPTLVSDDFAEAMRRLDGLDDVVFTALYGLTEAEVSTVREAFSGWNRG